MLQTLSRLKYLDIIGKEVQFKIENSELYKTVFGGILTLMLAVISLISIWFFGNDIIYHENPKFIQKQIRREEYEYLNFTNQNFFFAIRHTDYYGAFIDDPIYLIPKFKYEYYEKNRDTGELKLLNKIVIEMDKCNTSHIDNETLISENLQFYYCASLNNLTIGGDWGSNSLSELSANFMYKEYFCLLKPKIQHFNGSLTKRLQLVKMHVVDLDKEFDRLSEMVKRLEE